MCTAGQSDKIINNESGSARSTHRREENYEAYPQNKFRLQILPLLRWGHYDAHARRVCWLFWKALTQFADNRTTFTHRPLCLKFSRKSSNPPHVK
jgi:hypothetical protein